MIARLAPVLAFNCSYFSLIARSLPIRYHQASTNVARTLGLPERVIRPILT